MTEITRSLPEDANTPEKVNRILTVLRRTVDLVNALSKIVLGPAGVFPDSYTFTGKVVASSGVNSNHGTTSCTTATFTTIFTPTVAGVYIVFSFNASLGSANMGTTVVGHDGTNVAIQSKDVGGNMDYQISASAVQVKQSTGATKIVTWSYLFIPSV